jgi:hypothetical protein
MRLDKITNQFKEAHMVTLTGLVKKSFILATVFALVFAPVIGFAADGASKSTNKTTAKIISGTRVITNNYNAFGALVSSTQVSDQTIKTTSSITADDGTVTDTSSYSVQHTVMTSEWIGGGLKTTIVEGSSLTGGNPKDGAIGASNTAADGSWSKTDFKNIYQYDSNGRLQGVTGGLTATDKNGNTVTVNSKTTGSRGLDAEDKPLGTFTAYSVDTYKVLNGQALKDTTVSVQTTNGIFDGTGNDGVSVTTSTTHYDYELKGGSWVMSSMTEDMRSDTTNGESKGSWSEQHKVTTYNRKADGTLVDSTDPKTGAIVITEFTSTSHESNGMGGWSNWSAGLADMTYTVSYDSQQGYYISQDSTTQHLDTSSAGSGSSQIKAGNANAVESVAAAQAELDAAVGTSESSSTGSSGSSSSASITTNTDIVQPVLNLENDEAINAMIARYQAQMDQQRQDYAAAIARYQAQMDQQMQDSAAAIANYQAQVNNIVWY